MREIIDGLIRAYIGRLSLEEIKIMNDRLQASINALPGRVEAFLDRVMPIAEARVAEIESSDEYKQAAAEVEAEANSEKAV
jgi:hypothetical protein